jgi:hypothetical protein
MMGDIVLSVSVPLDDDGFLRRACPLCAREFKLKPLEGEVRSIAEQSMHAFLSADSAPDADEGENIDEDAEAQQRWCPYCAQPSPENEWSTREQTAYFMAHAQNVMASLVNEHLIRPMKRMSQSTRGGPISVTFEAEEMEQREPWISPEPNDMRRFTLPCCEREIKIEDGWSGTVTCLFCGFPHQQKA